MRKSATLWLESKRVSLAASAERMASFDFITWLTIVRLMRIVSSVSTRRCLTALGTSAWRSLSQSTMNPRSACKKILNKLSSTRLQHLRPWQMVVPRKQLQVDLQQSLELLFPDWQADLRPGAATGWMSSVDMIVVPPPSASSTSSARPLATVGIARIGGKTASTLPGWFEWNANNRSQILTWSLSCSRMAAADRLAVDKRTVAGSSGLRRRTGWRRREFLRVLAADRADIEHDVRILGWRPRILRSPSSGNCCPGFNPLMTCKTAIAGKAP